MTQYTDKQNVEIALAAYEDFKVGDDYKTESGLKVGKVKEVIHEKDSGLDTFVVQEPNGDMAIMYRGSELNKEDWLKNDFPIAYDVYSHSKMLGSKILGNKELIQGGTEQMKAATNLANKVLKENPNVQISLYGHSLGGIVVQQAIANLSDPNRLKEANILQAPNIYHTLTKEEKRIADVNKYKINNYIDGADIVTMDYDQSKGDSSNAVGIVHHLDTVTCLLQVLATNNASKFSVMLINLIIIGYNSHITKFYQFDKDGNLKTKGNSSKIEKQYCQSMTLNAQGKHLYEELKSKFASGGLSSAEKLYLDSHQTSFCMTALSDAAKVGHSAILKKVKDARAQSRTLFETRKKVPEGFSLTADEVSSAYNEGGVNYQSIVGKMQNETQKVMDASRTIKHRLMDYEKQVLSLVEKRLSEDTEFAKEFGLIGER